MFDFLKRLFGKKESQPVAEVAPVLDSKPMMAPEAPPVAPPPVVETPARPAAMTAKPKRERKSAKPKAEKADNTVAMPKKSRAKKTEKGEADVAWPFERPVEGASKRSRKKSAQ